MQNQITLWYYTLIRLKKKHICHLLSFISLIISNAHKTQQIRECAFKINIQWRILWFLAVLNFYYGEYGSINNATYFASTGMDIYKIYNQKINVGKQGKTGLKSLLEKNKNSKVYIMLGINELGYDFDRTINKFQELIDIIKSSQPGVIIYIEANLHVSESRSVSDEIFNNTNIDIFNRKLAKLADNDSIFYLDVNPLFDDDKGNLRADYTYDNTHVLGKYYKVWTDWIASNAVVK